MTRQFAYGLLAGLLLGWLWLRYTPTTPRAANVIDVYQDIAS